MATLLDLEASGEVLKLDAQLGVSQQPMRRIYLLPRVAEWMSNELPSLGSTWNIEEMPIQQFDSFSAIFCAGEPLDYGWRFKPLNHLADGIWELKTADLRMFGWFHQKDCFVITDCDLKQRIIDSGLYRPYCEQGVRFRDILNLDSPKFIPGEDPNAVVSNINYP